MWLLILVLFMCANWQSSPLTDAVLTSTADELVILSGRGPGKSHALYARECFRSNYWDNYRWTFYRSNYTDIKEHVTPLLHWSNDWLGDRLSITAGTNRVRVSSKGNGSYGVGLAAETEAQVVHHQGGSFHTLVVDECTLLEPAVIEAVGAVIRGRADEHKWQHVYLGNPFGPSHAKIRSRYVMPALAADPNGNVEHPDYYDKDLDCECWMNPVSGVTFKLNDMTGHILQDGEWIENREYRNGHWRIQLERKVDDEVISRDVEVILPCIHMNPGMETIAYVNSLKWQYRDNPIKREGWIYNNWDKLAGEYYPELPNWIKHKETKPWDTFIRGIDPGFRCAVGWFRINEAGNIHCFKAIRIVDKDIKAICADIKQVDQELEGEMYDEFIERGHLKPGQTWNMNILATVIDPAAKMRSPESSKPIMQLYSEEGIHTVAGMNARVAGWEGLRKAGNNGTFTICPDGAMPLIESLSTLVHDEIDPDDAKKQKGVDSEDHEADMARYIMNYGDFPASSQPPKPMHPDIAKALAKARRG